MTLQEFVEYHRPALEADEIRHNLLLAVIENIAKSGTADVLTWTLGAAGQCAIKTPKRAILLGDLTEAQCRELAAITRDLSYPGVLGQGDTGKWFTDEARALGLTFPDCIPQHILALTKEPAIGCVPGRPRRVTASDAGIFIEWTLAFIREAVPHDPIPSEEDLKRTIGEGRHWFWLLDDKPVSLAGIGRRTKTAAAINSVYTPPSFRGRGFAGAVTGAVATSIFAEGRKTACLYTDRRNPASNRCYLRIGFRPICESWYFIRNELG